MSTVELPARAAVVPSGESVGSRSVGEEDIVRLSHPDTAELWAWLMRTAEDIASPGGPAADRLEVAATVTKALPAGLLRAAHRYRNGGLEHDALLVRNLIPRLTIEPTPVTGYPRELTTRLMELCLLGVMGLLGEPFTFASLDSGRLVQHIIPRPGHEQAQTSMGSDAFLDWHVEDAFAAERCDYLGLLCVRGAAGTRTIFSAIRNAVLDPDVVAVLREARFVVRPDQAHGDLGQTRRPEPVITGPAADPEVCFDAIYLQPEDENDRAAAKALQQLKNALTASAASHEMQTGDLLIIDNRRVVHARTPFKPRFDGTDRWLMRTMVCSSLPIHRRRGSARVIGASA